MQILKCVESFTRNQSIKTYVAIVVAIHNNVVVEVEDIIDVLFLFVDGF